MHKRTRRSENAKRRRNEARFASATENLSRAIVTWLYSKDGDEFATVIRAFRVAAETEPVVARAAQDVFLRRHPVFGPILKTLSALHPNASATSPPDIASDAKALEDFRRVFAALPSGKAALATKTADQSVSPDIQGLCEQTSQERKTQLRSSHHR